MYFFLSREPTSDGGLSSYSWDHYFSSATQSIINKMSNHGLTNTSHLRVHAVCLPIVTMSIGSIKCLSMFAKMLLLEQKQTVRQMFLMRKTWPREGGIIQLVLGKVLYAYIIQGECELNTPSLHMTMRWQAQVGCFVMSTVLPSLLKNLCIIRRPECTTVGQKLFVRLLFISRQPSMLCSSAAAGVFSVHGTGW